MLRLEGTLLEDRSTGMMCLLRLQGLQQLVKRPRSAMLMHQERLENHLRRRQSRKVVWHLLLLLP
jgi:hypothetical protein